MSFLERMKKAKEAVEGAVALATTEEAEARMAICKACPLLRPMNRCKECGCFMDAKTKLKNVSCPLGKW